MEARRALDGLSSRPAARCAGPASSVPAQLVHARNLPLIEIFRARGLVPTQPPLSHDQSGAYDLLLPSRPGSATASIRPRNSFQISFDLLAPEGQGSVH